jgi:hypothetical protein
VLVSFSVLHGAATWSATWNAAAGRVRLANLLDDALEEVLIVTHQQDFKSALIG